MNKTASIPGRRRQHRLLLFQIVIAAVFLSLIWFSFGQNVLAPRKESEIPGKLDGLGLVSNVEGSEALSQVSKLHGTDINLVAAYIASYGHSDERVTVWVGKAENSSVAAELITRMTAGIIKGGSGFGNLKRLTIAEREVFQVDGVGGKHFFYLSGESQDKVIWLTIEATNTMPILEEAIRTF